MGTNEPDVVHAVLGCLEESGIRYAILHGADRVASGAVASDLDIVVGMRPHDVIQRLSEPLDRLGLAPILEWRYDVGGTLTVFVATFDGASAMQLDMLWDPRGIGKYAVKSPQLLDRAVTRSGLPTVRPVDELVYLLRKRAEKRDLDALAILRKRAASTPAGELADSIATILSSAGRRAVSDALGGGHGRTGVRPVRFAVDIARRLQRLRRPAGFLVAVSREEDARLVGERFGFLPNLTIVDSPVDSASARVALRSQSARLRPGLVITVGRPPLVAVDIEVDDLDRPDAFETLVHAMRRRTETRVGVA